jgi:hypothetical protein
MVANDITGNILARGDNELFKELGVSRVGNRLQLLVFKTFNTRKSYIKSRLTIISRLKPEILYLKV